MQWILNMKLHYLSPSNHGGQLCIFWHLGSRNTMGLILEQFLKFSEMFSYWLRKTNVRKRSPPDSPPENAFLCSQSVLSGAPPNEDSLNWMRVFVHLDLHTYTPRQLLIWARNRSDVCSQNRQNQCESNTKEAQSTVMSKRKSNTGGAQ